MKYLHLKEVTSTNDYLKARYLKLPNWTILTTDYQSSGRGRYEGRVWDSNKSDNLLCSILIKDPKVIKTHDCLVLLMGVTMYKVLTKLGLKNIKIKRPNDIYVNKHKICGILLESISLSDQIKALIIGVGLNLNQKKFNQGLHATSYYIEKKKKINVDKVLTLFIKTLQSELKKIKPNYQKLLLKQYQNLICERI